MSEAYALLNFLPRRTQAIIRDLPASARRYAIMNLADHLQQIITLTSSSSATLDQAKPEIQQVCRELREVFDAAGIHPIDEPLTADAVEQSLLLMAKWGNPSLKVEEFEKSSSEREQSLRTATIDRKPRRPVRSVSRGNERPIAWEELTWFTWHSGRVYHAQIVDWHCGVHTTLNVREPRNADATLHRVVLAFGDVPPLLSKPKPSSSTTGDPVMLIRVADPYLRIDFSGGVSLRVDSADDVDFSIDKAAASSTAIDGFAEARSILEVTKRRGDIHLNAGRSLEALLEYCDGMRRAVKQLDYAASPQRALTLLSAAFPEAEGSATVQSCFGVIALLNSFTDESPDWNQQLGNSMNLKPPASMLTNRDQMPRLFNALPSENTGVSPQLLIDEAERELRMNGNKDKAVENIVRYFLTAEPTVSLVGKVCSNMALAAMEERSWAFALPLCIVAGSFVPELYEKNAKRYFVALLQLGFGKELATTAVSQFVGDDAFAATVRTITQERYHGTFRFDQLHALRQSASADYAAKVTINVVPGRGRGVVAMQRICAGEVIACVRALCWSTRKDTRMQEDKLRASNHHRKDVSFCGAMHYGSRMLDPGSALLVKHLERQCRVPFSGRILKEAYALCNEDEHSQLSEFIVPNVDTPLGCLTTNWRPFFPPAPELTYDAGRLVETLLLNAMECDTMEAEEASAGLFVLPSLWNHSGLSNSFRFTIGQSMFLLATKDIHPGEEIVHPYFSSEHYCNEASLRELEDKWRLPPDSTQSAKRKTLLVIRNLLISGQISSVKGMIDLWMRVEKVITSGGVSLEVQFDIVQLCASLAFSLWKIPGAISSVEEEKAILDIVDRAMRMLFVDVDAVEHGFTAPSEVFLSACIGAALMQQPNSQEESDQAREIRRKMRFVIRTCLGDDSEQTLRIWKEKMMQH